MVICNVLRSELHRFIGFFSHPTSCGGTVRTLDCGVDS
jgi:hypothetical protein